MKEKNIEHILHHIDSNIILDEEQMEIVCNEDEKIMIIAGAGSGKTTTIVAKALYLIQYKKIKPEEILILSFTNETVNDLKQKLHDIMKYPVNIMTFHKLGLEIIKKENPNVVVLSNKEQLVSVIIQSLYQHDIEFQKQIRIFLNRYIKGVQESAIERQCNFDKIKGSKRYHKFFMLFFCFWNKWNEVSYEKQKSFRSKKGIGMEALFFSIFEKIITVYQIYKKRQSLYDFHDMIIVATKTLQNNTFPCYRYIFVDEYQDISINRFRFLQQLVKTTNARLVVVGDDWQSIYRFSGSDSRLFTTFQSYFPDSKLKFLTMTYRNSNELIQIAGNFIMKNPNQVRKSLRSMKNIRNPIVLVYYRKKKFHQKLNQILEKIATENPRQKILILGRYQHDIGMLKNNTYLKRTYKNYFCFQQYTKMPIVFLTIHAAKGLGFDQVILINLENSMYGFPSNVKDHKLIASIDEHLKENKFEERRLFYVALTRTKNRVYLCIPYFHQSQFVRELKKLF